MTDVRTLIPELAKLGAGEPIVTLYLDTHWKDEQQRERVRLFFREREREARTLFGAETPEGHGIAETLAQLEEWLAEVLNRDRLEDAKGILVVASAPRKLFYECALPEAVPQAMYVDFQPRLFPLVELMSASRPLFAVAVDSKGAEILQLEEGQVVDESDIQREVPNRHKRGGWRQRKIQQHIKHHITVVWQECAALLARLASEVPSAYVVLFGTDENLRNFVKLLPKALVDRIIGMEHQPVERPRLIERAKQLVDEERLVRSFAAIDAIIGNALSDRTGAVGLEDVLRASNERRIRTLAMSRNFDAIGFLCTSCNGIWHAGATGCEFCGAETRRVSLREELVRRCVNEHCEILIAADSNALEPYRGVGALLRHLSGDPRQNLPKARGDVPGSSATT